MREGKSPLGPHTGLYMKKLCLKIQKHKPQRLENSKNMTGNQCGFFSGWPTFGKTWLGNNVSWLATFGKTWLGNNVSWLATFGMSWARKQCS